jgi:hypothetical protein
MQEKTQQEQYIDYINDNILSKIDYKQLGASYDGDRKYAKEVLRALHGAVEKCYGTLTFDSDSCQDSEGYVTLPGIAYGNNTGKIAVVLVDIDLGSSGEHWGTTFLLDAGVVEQFPESVALAARVKRDFITYDYCYTPTVGNDIHVNFGKLPQEMKDILKEVRSDEHSEQKDSSWTRFENAKNKATDTRADAPPKSPKRKTDKEI